MTDDEIEQMRRRIDCPVDWCVGAWIEHGGEGQPPERWIHKDEEGFTLPHGASLGRDQEGTGPVTWMFRVEWEGSTFLARHDTNPREIARRLRDIADSIDDIASLCDR